MHHRLGLAALLAALAAMTPASASAATNLGAYWHLDEGSGTTAVDTSGNANHGTINGAPARVSGRFGRALHFDGQDDNVFIARSASLEPQSITVEGWVRGTSTPGAYKHIISYGASECFTASYALFSGSGGGIAFAVSQSSTSSVVSPQAPQSSIWDGAWHHVAGTYDGTVARLFVDGAEVGSGASAPAPIAYGLPTNPNGVLGMFGGGPCDLSYIGDLDEPRIWRRALSASEMAASAAMGGPTTETLEEKIDASEAIVYTAAFSSPSNMKISIESGTAAERISSVKLQGVLPGLLGMASCRNDLLGLLLAQCDIKLTNDGKTAAVTVRKLNVFTRGAVLRVKLSSGRTFDVDVDT
jgi:hypothetical protein